MICLKSGTSGRAVGVGAKVVVGEGSGDAVAVGRGDADGLTVSVAGKLVPEMGVHAAKPAIRRQKKVTVIF